MDRISVRFRRACLFALLAFASSALPAQAQTSVGFEIGSIAVAGNSATIKVVLNAASTDAVSVQYATQDGTAVSPGDYTATTGTVVVPAGFTSQTFTINGINSAAVGKNFSATLANPVNAALGTSLVTITIDAGAPPGGGGGDPPKDPPPPVLPVVQFESASYLCVESCGRIKLTVKLSAASKEIVTVEFWTLENRRVERR